MTGLVNDQLKVISTEKTFAFHKSAQKKHFFLGFFLKESPWLALFNHLKIANFEKLWSFTLDDTLSSIVRTELTSLWEETHKEGMAYIMGIVHSHEDESKLAFFKKKNVMYATSKFPIIHPICPEKIFHNPCFSFVLGITAVRRETENSAYAKFWGANKLRCIMGNVEQAYSTKRDLSLYIRHLHISHNTPCLPPQIFP